MSILFVNKSFSVRSVPSSVNNVASQSVKGVATVKNKNYDSNQ